MLYFNEEALKKSYILVKKLFWYINNLWRALIIIIKKNVSNRYSDI